MARRNWAPSRSAKREFAQKMDEIRKFCSDHGIYQSTSGDSYYFMLDGVSYRVSNHSVESSPYHSGRIAGEVYIHASKTRIMDIYNDLVQGYALDGRGNRKEAPE